MSILWAALIVIATWPAMVSLQARLGGRRGPAVAIMTLAILLVVLVPLTLAVLTIVDHAEGIVARAQSLASTALPPPPQWLEHVPVVGGKLAAKWRESAALGPEERLAMITPYTGRLLQWFVGQAGSVGMTLLQFLLTTIIAAIMYANAETVRAGILSFARRLAGAEGEAAAVLAGKAARGVALGVVVTAIVQATLGGIGLVVAKVPAAALLTAVMFMLCLAQVGAGPVLIPAVIWLYWKGSATWAAVLLVFSVLALTIDNVLRPVLIKKGVDLPLIMIFAGVIGGLVAFGVIGLFIGPVALAITYTLLKAWVSGGVREEEGGPFAE
jgi:predicted PurR-regulated permease PerM